MTVDSLIAHRIVPKRISAGWLRFETWYGPMLWTIPLAVLCVAWYSGGVARIAALFVLVFIVLPMLLELPFHLLLMLLWRHGKSMPHSMADEVLDEGDCLILRIGGQNRRARLSDIRRISLERRAGVTLIALWFEDSAQLGEAIFFHPIRKPFWSLFARNHVASDLLLRVERARQQDARR
jgi:hypothetical protein